jgi:hypothetical protein
LISDYPSGITMRELLDHSNHTNSKLKRAPAKIFRGHRRIRDTRAFLFLFAQHAIPQSAIANPQFFLRGKAELGPAALGIRLHFAAVLLIRRLERAQSAHFLENTFRIELVLQPLQRAVDRLTFANEYFWHRNSTPILANSLPNGEAEISRLDPFRQIGGLRRMRFKVR